MNTQQEGEKAPQKSDVALREEAILSFWQEHDIFNKTLEQDAPNGEFIFYDGPPFATGLPHYGHILAGTIKDAIPRFWTMNGYRVPRKWGWDCHGLPLENLIEKKLGLATKRDIEEYGIQNFNEAARGAVMEFADDWAQIVPRMGRWADMEDDYKTMDSTYTESVWWVFSQLHKKGLVYEGFKSMHLCPRCGTTLSNFEVNQGYKDIKDIAITVKLPLLDDAGEKTDSSLLVWTTTPWTMPGNMAAAVHNEHDYVTVSVTTDEGTEKVVLAKERLSQLGTDEYEVLETIPGSDLVGKSYEPPFSYFKDSEGIYVAGGELERFDDTAWKIYHADYVELGEEGTGAVHLAPAYGDDDMKLAQEHNIPILHHVDQAGHFLPFVTDFAGQLVKPKDDDDAGVSHLDADIEIVKALKANGKLFRKENVTHSYPHCWRCDTPLLNYATTSWFVEVTKIKDELVEENNKIHWVPEHVGRARFGKWLEGARDWAVSRQRYWGAPLPIWRNSETQEIKVFGSLADLQEYAPKSGNTYSIMRHAQSVSNERGVLSAHDTPENGLTDAGKEQVKTAAAELKEKGITKILHSPLNRTTETAALVAEALGLSDDAVVADERLTEVAFGVCEDKPVEQYLAFLGNGAGRLTKSPENGGENWTEVKNRTGAFMKELESELSNEHVLIISHNGTLQMLQAAAAANSFEETAAHIDDDSYDLENAQVKEVVYTHAPRNDKYELDFHRPYIDEIELFEEDTKLERVPDVFDCWFESGSMPYGQKHFLGEAKETFDPENGLGFPANFIAEGLDQTRGWFYSLIVLGTAIFGKSPYQNVIVNGLVLAEDGKKMSKSLQNYPDPMDLADRTGVDAMRFYLLSSPIVRSEDLNFSEKEVLELQRKNIGRLHNVLTMYEMFADDTPATGESVHVLDRWIVARLNELTIQSTAGYKNYELDKATRPIIDFVDDLSVWYLRRSRDRLKGEDAADAQAALGTLRYVLRELAKVMAPVMPFFAEHLYQGVKAGDEPESVHLTSWPEAGVVDTELLATMRTTREVVTAALEARTKAGVKVRQPLASLATNVGLTDEFAQIVADEVNVKTVTTNGDSLAVLDTEITDELKAEGDMREFMRSVQGMRKDADLQQEDRIVLTLQTSTEGQAFIAAFQDDLQKTVGATEVVFADTEGTEAKAGEYSFVVKIKKI